MQKIKPHEQMAREVSDADALPKVEKLSDGDLPLDWPANF
jgi:hypothetical protein